LKLRSTILVAALFLFGSLSIVQASHAICADKKTFMEIMQRRGEAVQAGGVTTMIDGKPTPLLLAMTATGGSWTLFYIRQNVIYCAFISGTGWTMINQIKLGPDEAPGRGGRERRAQ